MKPVDRLLMRLDIMRIENLEAIIVMKSKRYQPFVTKVASFDFEEKDSRVMLLRSASTTYFPTDADDYLTYIKNIKSVDRYHPPEPS